MTFTLNPLLLLFLLLLRLRLARMNEEMRASEGGFAQAGQSTERHFKPAIHNLMCSTIACCYDAEVRLERVEGLRGYQDHLEIVECSILLFPRFRFISSSLTLKLALFFPPIIYFPNYLKADILWKLGFEFFLF